MISPKTFILAMRNDAELEADLIGRLTANLPKTIVEKAWRYRRFEDRQACLLARHLVLAGMAMFDVAPDLADIEISASGRPSLPGRIDFNITHTKGLVACAFACDRQIGLDIEVLQPLQLADFERFFSSAERKLIGSAVDQNKALIEFWTLKEAVCKAAGTGILQDLPEIEFSLAEVPQPSIFHAGKIWQARQFNVGADYAAAIASESLVEVDLHWVQLDGSGLRRS